MPDEAAPEGRVLNAGNNFLDRAGLVLAQDHFGQFIILCEKDNIVVQKPQETLSVKEGLNLALVVARLDFFPVEEILPVGAPAHPVEKIQHLGDFKDL